MSANQLGMRDMKKPWLERVLEGGLFRARWLMAPFYVGLIAAVVALLVVFFQELIHQIPMLWTFDPVTHAYAMTADDAIMLAFQKMLVEAGYICTIRATRGDDIDAACGQLVGQVQDRTRRSEKWRESVARSGEILRSPQ